MFTLYSADFIGNPGNCSHPHKTVVMDTDSLKAAVDHDYVCAEYKHHYRNGANFLSADCLPVDCDNDHSEDPKDWITPADVLEAFPGVSIAIHYSRFNQREKNGKPARPKFHVLFPIERVTDATLYSDMKKLVNSIFPYFDTNALDAVRFFFGTQESDVELYPGRMNLTEFLNDDEFDAGLPGDHEKDTKIPEGSRNATMSRFAGIVIKKYGYTEKAYQSFAVRRRDSKNITSTLKETHPMLEISPSDLDAGCFLLCTPEATFDLRKGMAGAREHSADDFITKITSVSPGSKGAQLWQDNLDLIFQKDQQLIDYVQMICGLAAIGKVFVEALIIAYGDGRNGKFTFWNAISRVLGLYSGIKSITATRS